MYPGKQKIGRWGIVRIRNEGSRGKMKYSFENKNPLWHTHEGLVPRVNQIVIGEEIINVYPTNDGQMWYYDKQGRVVVVE